MTTAPLAPWEQALLTEATTGTVICHECGDKHVAEFSHLARFGGQRVFAVVCIRDWLTDYYTEDVVTLDDPAEAEPAEASHVKRSHGYECRAVEHTVDGHDVTMRHISHSTVAAICECGATAVSSTEARCASLIRRKHKR